MVDGQPLDCRPIHFIGGNGEKTSITCKGSQNIPSIQHGHVGAKEHSGNQFRTFHTLG
jgi:hypothetical protein